MGNTTSIPRSGFHPYFKCDKCSHISRNNVNWCEKCKSYAIYKQYPFIKNGLLIKENKIYIQILKNLFNILPVKCINIITNFCCYQIIV